jgi:hypothetical protein
MSSESLCGRANSPAWQQMEVSLGAIDIRDIFEAVQVYMLAALEICGWEKRSG